MKFSCSVYSAGESVDFYSQRNLFVDFNCRCLLRDHLDFSVSKKPSHSRYKLFYSDNSENSVVYSGGNCYLGYSWDKVNLGETLLYAAYPLFEEQRHRKHWLTAYSAAVSLSDNGILLLGKSGAGKTSVAVDLCRNFGAELAGNDLTILGLQDGELLVKGGTKFLFFRYESIKKSLPELIDVFPKQPDDPWRYKIKVDPGDVGVSTRKLPLKINQVYFVHVDESYSEIFIQEEKSLAAKLFLIENFSRYIKGCCLNILGGEKFEQLGFVPSFDNEEHFYFRCQLVDLVLSKAKYISGPLQLITDYIAKSSY